MGALEDWIDAQLEIQLTRLYDDMADHFVATELGIGKCRDGCEVCKIEQQKENPK